MASFTGPFGLYLHVPFCPYNKVLLREELVGPYFAALRTELDLYGTSELRFESLYVGGGIPSLCLEEVGSVVEQSRGRVCGEVVARTGGYYQPPDAGGGLRSGRRAIRTACSSSN